MNGYMHVVTSPPTFIARHDIAKNIHDTPCHCQTFSPYAMPLPSISMGSHGNSVGLAMVCHNNYMGTYGIAMGCGGNTVTCNSMDKERIAHAVMARHDGLRWRHRAYTLVTSWPSLQAPWCDHWITRAVPCQHVMFTEHSRKMIWASTMAIPWWVWWHAITLHAVIPHSIAMNTRGSPMLLP